MVTGEDQISSAGCSPRRRNSPLARATTVSDCVITASTNLQSPALPGDRGVDAHRRQRGGPEQVDGEPRGLEVGIAGVAFEDVAEDAADVVAADRLTPRAPGDGLRHEGVAIGDEEGRWRRCAERGCRPRDPGWSSRPTISG